MQFYVWNYSILKKCHLGTCTIYVGNLSHLGPQKLKLLSGIWSMWNLLECWRDTYDYLSSKVYTMNTRKRMGLWRISHYSRKPGFLYNHWAKVSVHSKAVLSLWVPWISCLTGHILYLWNKSFQLLQYF